MSSIKWALAVVSIIGIIAGCAEPMPELPENYHEDLAAWKKDRDERLRAENGWVNLVGLLWLDEGRNTFGASDSNKIRFPEHAPGKLGSIYLEDSILTFTAAPGSAVTVDSVVADSAVVYDAANEIQAVMGSGRYQWFIIERSGKFGIRLRDLEHPMMQSPLDIEYFDWSPKWRVEAEYRPFDEPRMVTIDNVVGLSYDEEVLGELVFEVDNKEYSLWPLPSGDRWFVLFADATSGDETYGSGRYLVIDAPDEGKGPVIDFNKAYNPPCAFTDFATCPLPPRQNFLEIPVRAGEKEFHREAH